MVDHADIDHTGLTGVAGNVAADAIWNAKGDLAVGTGADTAQRLAVGTNGQVLTADSGETTGAKWATPSSSALNIVYKSADEIVNNSAALQDDNHLFYAMGANEEVEFEINGWFDSGTTPDIKHAVVVPAGAVLYWSATGFDVSGTAYNDALVQTTSGTAGNQGGTGVGTLRHFRIKGYARTTGTSGNLQLQWAQNTANATDTTMHRGSSLKVWQLA